MDRLVEKVFVEVVVDVLVAEATGRAARAFVAPVVMASMRSVSDYTKSERERRDRIRSFW